MSQVSVDERWRADDSLDRRLWGAVAGCSWMELSALGREVGQKQFTAGRPPFESHLRYWNRWDGRGRNITSCLEHSLYISWGQRWCKRESLLKDDIFFKDKKGKTRKTHRHDWKRFTYEGRVCWKHHRYICYDDILDEWAGWNRDWGSISLAVGICIPLNSNATHYTLCWDVWRISRPVWDFVVAFWEPPDNGLHKKLKII